MKTRILGILLSFGILWYSPQAVLAQTPTNQGIRFTTSPLPIDLTTTPGKTVTTTLKFRNSGSTTEQIKVGLLKFTANGDSGNPKLEDRQPGDDFFDWVSFSPAMFTAVPNVWQNVTMTIKVPQSAAFDYYYAATFSRAGSNGVTNQSAQVVGSTATLVLLEVQVPGAKREIQVSSFKPSHGWYEFLPVDFNVTLANTGNVHAAPYGTIYITKNGQQTGKVDVNMAKGNILPSTTRTFETSWQDGFPVKAVKMDNGSQVLDAHQQPVETLNWDFAKVNQLRWGKYTAHLVMAYDNGTRDVPLEATTTFWVIPWRLALAVMAIPLLPALLVFLLMRWWMNRSHRRIA